MSCTLQAIIPQELLHLYEKRKNYADDSGFDLYTTEYVVVEPFKQAKINFKIRARMLNTDNNYCGYMLVPRSSIVKTPLRLSNSIGIIDKGYTGELMAFVDNFSDQTFIINKHISYFQVISPGLEPIALNIVDSLSNTDRGSGGFGSTGI